jgi:hypothetical protein
MSVIRGAKAPWHVRSMEAGLALAGSRAVIGRPRGLTRGCQANAISHTFPSGAMGAISCRPAGFLVVEFDASATPARATANSVTLRATTGLSPKN